MFRFRRDAGKTNVVAQFLDEPGLVLLQIVEDSLHRRFVARPARRSKVPAAPWGRHPRRPVRAASRRALRLDHFVIPDWGLMPQEPAGWKPALRAVPPRASCCEHSFSSPGKMSGAE